MSTSLLVVVVFTGREFLQALIFLSPRIEPRELRPCEHHTKDDTD